MILWLIKIIWGETNPCNHEWELEQTVTFTNGATWLYVCKKCGKFDKQTINSWS